MRLAALVAAVAAALDLLVLGLLHLGLARGGPSEPSGERVRPWRFRVVGHDPDACEGVAAIALATALRRERAAALLLAVVGLLKLAIPLFPVDALGMPATPAGQMHNVLGNVTFFLFPLAALLLFRALRRTGSRLAPGIAVVLAIATVECS